MKKLVLVSVVFLVVLFSACTVDEVETKKMAQKSDIVGIDRGMGRPH